MIFLFLIGLSVGSFLNAIAFRIANDRPWITGRSFCPRCGKTLTWWQLIPLLSFIILRGRCFYCKRAISWQYPVIEFLTGLSFALAYIYSKEPAALVLNLITITVLMFIALYDFRNFLILDSSVIIGSIIALALAYLKGQTIISVLSGLALALFFYGIYRLSRGTWIGLGDVKLAVFLGILAGPLILATLIIASWVGTLVGVGLILMKKAHLKTELPFGTFLAGSAILVLIFEPYLEAYLTMFFV